MSVSLLKNMVIGTLSAVVLLVNGQPLPLILSFVGQCSSTLMFATDKFMNAPEPSRFGMGLAEFTVAARTLATGFYLRTGLISTNQSGSIVTV
jgi:hypothetical protein